MPSEVTESIQYETYVSITLISMLYGVEAVLYFETIHAVLILRTKKRRRDWMHLIFSTIMFLLITMYFVTTALFGDQICAFQPGSPCNTTAYNQGTAASVWYLSMGRAAVFALQLMTDGLLIHRCWIMYSRSFFVVALPSFLWISALCLGGAANYYYDFLVNTFYVRNAVILSLAYYSVTVVLNVTLSGLIAYRVIHHGKVIQEQLGHAYSTVYFAVAGIIIESALPFTISGIVLLIVLPFNNTSQIPSGAVYYMMTCISPQLLILRIVRRQSVIQSTSSSGTTSLGTNIRIQQFHEVHMTVDGTYGLQPLSKVYLADSVDSEGGSP